MKNKTLILGIGAALFLASCTKKENADRKISATDSTAAVQSATADSTAHATTALRAILPKMHWTGTVLTKQQFHVLTARESRLP
jgi:hypothetical protein